MAAAAPLLAGLLGATVGSFWNVVIQRLPAERSLGGRSQCASCGTQIKAYDNIPLVSWLVLRGRCRHCSARIPVRYPLVEALTALLFVAVVLVRGAGPEAWPSLALAAVLVPIAFIDLEHRLIPNRILAPAAVLGVALVALGDPAELPAHLAAGAGAFALLLLAALAYPGGMGMGDVKLAGVMGLYLGVAVAPALLAAFLCGSLVGVAILVREGAAARKKGIPFGPFLAVGGIAGILAGPELVELYRSHLL